MPGTIGRYQVQGRIGLGVLGVEYRAFDPLFGRDVVVKTADLAVPRGIRPGPAFAAAFDAQARAWGTLSHPNVTSLFDVGEDAGVPYLVVELVEGRTLAAWIEAGRRFEAAEGLGLVAQMASALDHAHERGVIHGAVNPSHVVLSAEGRVKVTDFGLTRLLDAEVSDAERVLATPSYFSPEQVRGQPLDARSDIFSLGVCAFEVVSGQKPFPGTTTVAMLQKLVHDPPVDPKDLGARGLVVERWRQVFGRVLAKKPEDRYRRALDFVQELGGCVVAAERPAGAPAVAATPLRRDVPAPDESGTLPAGTGVDRYSILSPLGRGGMGAVYKARDTVLDEVVALKILPAAADSGSARRFVSEIKLARRVSHRHVCRINEYGEDAGRRYIAMELVEGDHLRDLLRNNGPAPLGEGIEIAIQIAEGLHAIHEAGIIHRDIKASNVMLDRQGVAKIMDLGVAKLEATVDQASTAAGLVIGTPYYMSPEQARGERLDFRTDIYSLGVVMYELFTGELPFRGESPIATLFKHLNEPPDLQRLPEVLRPLVGMALAKRADERFATARDLADALGAVAPSEPPGAAPSPSPWHRARPAPPPGPPPRDPATGAVPRSQPAGSAPPRPATAAGATPLAELSGLTRALRAASVARDHAFPSRTRLSEPEFGQIDVFICYRRGDSEDVSGRIHDRLVAAFGSNSVFKDVDSIPPGANFKKYLQAVVQRCLVQLVIIGRNWVDARDESGQRRLDDPADWVRIEIEAALQRDVPIIPLLVHSAPMPREQQLPPSLAELAYIQNASVRRDPDFHVDMDRLIGTLRRYLPAAKRHD